jgi:putative ABC transport system permease protein
MTSRLILSVAGRNAVKDRHRSFAVFSAVALSIAVLTFALGLLVGMRQMFLNLAFDTIGHLSVQRAGYLERAAMLPVDFMVEDAGAVARLLSADPAVLDVSQELLAGGMLMTADVTADVLVRGVDIRDGHWNTRYRQGLTSGAFPATGGEVLVGKATAAYLHVRPGSAATLMAYNANGGVNAIQVTVAGVFETDRTEENEFLALTSIATARRLLQVGEVATSVLVRLRDADTASDTALRLNHRFASSGLEAHPWKRVYAEVAVGLIWVNIIIVLLFSIIVAVITFGIVNTHLISVFERVRVLGTMRSIGLSRPGLMGMVMTETALVGSAGSLIGVALGAAAIRVVAVTGIDMGPELDGIARIICPTFSGQIGAFCFVVGVIVSLLGALYPAWIAGKMKPLEAMGFR